MAVSEAAASSSRSTHQSDKEAAQAGGGHLPGMPGAHLPTGTAGRVLWWGGLAAVAAVGIVDWPVAALIGAGSWVAEQYAKAARQAEAAEREAS